MSRTFRALTLAATLTPAVCIAATTTRHEPERFIETPSIPFAEAPPEPEPKPQPAPSDGIVRGPDGEPVPMPDGRPLNLR